MDFYAALDEVVELLRSRGRVSYRALKEHLGLDASAWTHCGPSCCMRTLTPSARSGTGWYGPPDTTANGDS